MALFLTMLAKLFPLYVTMGAGAALGRAFGNMGATLARIQIYLIAPVVVLVSMTRLQLSADLFMLPLTLGLLCVVISTGANALCRLAGYRYAPLVAQASGGANLGYLGLPIAMIVLPEAFLPPYVLTMAGGILYENTLGYYWIARGRFSSREALRSLSRVPLVYAMAMGLVLNACGVSLPSFWEAVVRDFFGAYVVLGALIVGFGLADKGGVRLDPKLLSVLFGVKFLLWPFMTVTLLAALRATPFAVPVLYEPILLLMSALPLAANTAALASLLEVYPREASGAVALSTLLSLGIVPAYSALFGFVHG